MQAGSNGSAAPAISRRLSKLASHITVMVGCTSQIHVHADTARASTAAGTATGIRVRVASLVLPNVRGDKAQALRRLEDFAHQVSTHTRTFST